MPDFSVPDFRWPRSGEPCRVGFRRPYLRFNVTQQGQALDLSDASFTVTFTAATLAGVTKINGAAAIGGNGYVEYQWAAADTDTAGDYAGYFSVTDSTGRRADYPRGARIIFQIIAA